MTPAEDGHQVWSRLYELDDRDLRLLVEVAVELLAGGADDPDRPTDLPRSMLIGQVRDLLAADGVAVDDPRVADQLAGDGLFRPAVLPVLEQLASDPQVADAIAEAYEARQRMMVVDGGFLVGAALLLLVLKLKRVRLAKLGVDVELYEAKADAVQAIKGLIGQ
jgi:hypothetical protein